MPKLHDLLNKYSLHTFAPDVDITDEEAVRVEGDLKNIRELLTRGYEKNLERFKEKQMKIDDFK